MTVEKKIIIEASSVESALSDVSRQWQIPVEKLDAKILSEQRKGFLGLGGKILKVEISEKAQEAQNEKIENSKPEVKSDFKAESFETQSDDDDALEFQKFYSLRNKPLQ